MEPYELSEADWNSLYSQARERLAGNYVQSHPTKSSASQMVAAEKELKVLMFGIPEDHSKKLDAVRSGDLKLSEFGRIRFIQELERPINYRRVRIKAKRLGLIQ